MIFLPWAGLNGATLLVALLILAAAALAVKPPNGGPR